MDAQPELLFRLRAVDEKELVAHIDAALPTAKQAPAPDKVLDADDLSALFGLDMDADERAIAIADGAPPAQQKPIRGKKPAQSKPSGTTPKAAGQSSIGLAGRNQAASRALIKRNGTGKAPAQNSMQPKVPATVRGSRIARKTAARHA